MPPEVTYAIGVLAVVAALGLAGLWLASGRVVRRWSPDPADPPDNYDLPFEHVTIPARDGVLLGGWLTAGRGSRRATVIIAPGLFGSMDGDTHLVPMLAAAGFDVLQFDWRAHGSSDGSRTTLGLDEVHDLRGAVDFLQARGVKQIGVLGFSFGGAVAIREAAGDQRVRCLCVDGPFARVEGALSGAIQERIGVRLPIIGWLLVRLIEIRLGGRPLAKVNPLGVVGEIAPRPVLFIQGGRDLLVPMADQEALLAAAGEPKALWRVEGVGHREAHQVEPAAYRARVVGFFLANLRG
jgi:fermentation-respiration switch protein FrsA (DUF1100 family)